MQPGQGGDQRITIATLDTEVANLSRTAKLYPGTVQLSQVQLTQQTLTWLIRFKIDEELARQAGITISTGQAQSALGAIYSQAKANAQAQGIPNVTLDLILVANGIPPNLHNEVGRYQAINDQFVQQANGGQTPASTSAQSAAGAKLTKARCMAAKELNIKVNRSSVSWTTTRSRSSPRPSRCHGRPARPRRRRRRGCRRLADRPRDQPAGGAWPAQLAGLGGAAVR